WGGGVRCPTGNPSIFFSCVGCATGTRGAHAFSAGLLFPITPISHHHSRALPGRNLHLWLSPTCGPIDGDSPLAILTAGVMLASSQTSTRNCRTLCCWRNHARACYQLRGWRGNNLARTAGLERQDEAV